MAGRCSSYDRFHWTEPEPGSAGRGRRDGTADVHDADVRVAIGRAHEANYGGYHPRKMIWLVFSYEGVPASLAAPSSD